METYFDSHLDLLQRNLAKTSDRLKLRAEATLNDLKKKDVLKDGPLKLVPAATNIQLERELQRYKLKVRTCAACGLILDHSVDLPAPVGFPTPACDNPDMALREGHSDSREGYVLHGCHVPSPDCSTLRHRSRVSALILCAQLLLTALNG